MGRYGLLVCSVVFCIGMLVSTLTPSWISSEIENPTTGSTTIIEFGPFYSRSRDCTPLSLDANGEVTEEECTDWVGDEIDNDDCHAFSDSEEIKEKICKQHNTWRYLAMLCMLIVLVTSILVAAATCTQCVTCGCCGGSFDMIASIAFWVEVLLSIVAWSFCVSVVTILRGEAFTDLLVEEAENIGGIQEVTDIADGNFLWGFWIFILSGTIIGALCATFAGWAAEGSFLNCLVDAVACLFCCKKK